MSVDYDVVLNVFVCLFLRSLWFLCFSWEKARPERGAALPLIRFRLLLHNVIDNEILVVAAGDESLVELKHACDCTEMVSELCNDFILFSGLIESANNELVLLTRATDDEM